MSALVLLHGWGMSARVWDDLRGALHVSARASDLPGYGHAPIPARYTLDAAVEQLAREAGDVVDVVGWSFGATLAMHWASIRPQQVRRLVLLAATPRFAAAEDWPHGVSAQTLQTFEGELQRSPDALMRRFCTLQAQGEHDARAFAGALGDLRTRAAPSVLAASLALLAASDLRERYRALTQPMLLLHGERDAIVPVAAARWMAAHNAHAQLEVFDAAGHALPVSQAAVCARRIERFLHE